jgi:signal recognition particle subunit SRP72
VQQLYVLQSLGKSTEAESVAAEISVEAIPDPATRAVAKSNMLLAAASPPNPFHAHKAFNCGPKLAQSDRLFSYQSIPFSSNKRTIDIQAFKTDGMKIPSSKDKDEVSVSPEALLSSVFSAAAHARNEVSKAAIKKVLPELSKRPNDIGLITIIVQMYVLTGNIPAATGLMESLFKRLDGSTAENEQDLRFNPGLVSILIALYRNQGRRSQVKQELAKAATYWRHKSRAPASLLRAAGSSLLETSNLEDTEAAAEIFTKLREQQPDDKAAIAGFVASHAASDSTAISAEVDKLSSVADLTSNIDIDALENAGIPQSSNALALAQLTRSRKRPAPEDAPSKPKRISQSRLPKDYDPDKKPDPERWLPMKDRSYYRPPKGKRKGKKGGGDDRTQGGAVNENLNIDAKPISAGVSSVGGGGGGGKKKGKKR